MFSHHCSMTPRKTTRDDSRKSDMSSFLELACEEECSIKVSVGGVLFERLLHEMVEGAAEKSVITL